MSGGCPVCGGASSPRLSARDRNRAISGEVFRYRRCDACATVFLENPPADLGAYYPADYYEGDADESRSPTEQAKLAIVRARAAAGRLIEIGPGRGGFAKAASDAGFAVTGVEMDAGACRHLRERLGIEAVNTADPAGALPDLAPADVIAMWHVIEHVPDPGALLDAAVGALAPDGVLVVATPNPASLQFRLLGARWVHLDAPRHLALIPAPALIARACASGAVLDELVDDDRTARDWNAFGWQHALRPGTETPVSPLVAKAGSAIALGLSPAERRAGRATAYTAVFRNTRAR